MTDYTKVCRKCGWVYPYSNRNPSHPSMCPNCNDILRDDPIPSKKTHQTKLE